MEITDVNQYHLKHDLNGSYEPTWIPGYSQESHETDLFEIRTDEGITGVTACPSFAGGLDYEDWIKLVLVGEDPYNIEKILKKLESVNLLGPRTWHLEVALWDIMGKDVGKPIYKLLGGRRKKIAAYASTGEVQKADKRLEYVEKRKKEGFKAVKLRFQSEDYKEDLKIARRIRDEFPNITLMVDANMGWKLRVVGEGVRWKFNDALQVTKGLEEIGDVEWLEEPLGRRNFRGLARLRDKSNVPIAGGELNNGIADFREFIRHDSLDIFQPDATLATGILNAKKIASMARVNGIEFAPHTWTNGIGLAANLHVMAATHASWCEFPLEPPAWNPDSRDFMLERPIEQKDGFLTPPSKPGLGVEID